MASAFETSLRKAVDKHTEGWISTVVDEAFGTLCHAGVETMAAADASEKLREELTAHITAACNATVENFPELKAVQ